MDNYLTTLSFSLLPLILVAAFSLVLPAMGAILAIRNEIMLALALPSIANAGMAFGLLCGIDPDHELPLYGFATIATLLTIVMASRINSANTGQREIFPATLFVGGQILSSTFSAVSPVAHTHVSHLLNGEILAAGTVETIVLAVVCIVLLSVGVRNFRKIFSWSADGEYFRIGIKRYRIYVFAMYTAFAVVITLGVATLGNLLITTFLVLPALFGNVKAGGIQRYIVLVTIIGVVGSISGFMVALKLNIPPAINASVGIGAVGICTQFFYRRR